MEAGKKHGGPGKPVAGAKAALEGADSAGNGHGVRDFGTGTVVDPAPDHGHGKDWPAVADKLNGLAAKRLPHHIVEASTPHDAPAVHHTPYSGIRITKGPFKVKWSDGHTE